jgi:membrane associated rhomboid family serine protease
VTYQLAFSSAGELVIGVALLYTLRQFERHWGSRKFGAFVVISKLVSFLIGSSALAWHRSSTPGANLTLAAGPYGLVFAGLVQWHFDIPASPAFSFLGLHLSEKMITYLFAAQLTASSSSASLASSAAGAPTPEP